MVSRYSSDNPFPVSADCCDAGGGDLSDTAAEAQMAFKGYLN
jgi:hypothetical protein